MMKTPLAQQGARARPYEPRRGFSHALGVEPAIAAQGAAGVVVGHDVGHGAVALRLDDQPALELQARADQRREGAGLAQQVGHGFRIVVPGEHLVDGGTQADDPPAHGFPSTWNGATMSSWAEEMGAWVTARI